MSEVISLLQHYGLLVDFISVLMDEGGLPRISPTKAASEGRARHSVRATPPPGLFEVMNNRRRLMRPRFPA